MCGISGFAIADGAGSTCSREALVETTRALTHRGPDQEGYFWAPNIGLGSRRLSIIDVSESGRMPLFDESRTRVVVQNGEIYNFRDLRTSLEARGHRFGSRSDTEVIVHLYEDEGTASFARLEGMFAIAIWDAAARSLVLARDRFGEKPLYYHIGEQGHLVFGSELKALVASPLFKLEVDWEAMQQFLELGYILGPRTPFKNTFKLPPAHFLRFDLATGARHLEAYWTIPSPSFAIATDPSAEGKYIEEFSALFDESVRARLVSDVPIGAFLSSGVDSTLVVAAMARFMDRRVETYSIGFRDGKDNGENAAASAVARQLGASHTALTFDVGDFNRLLGKLPDLIDDPIADTAGLGVHMITSAAKARGISVMLSGDGGDELFFGYPLHRWAKPLWYAHAMPASMRSLGKRAVDLWSRVADTSRMAKAAKVVGAPTLSDAMYYLLGYGAWSPSEIAALWPDRPSRTNRHASQFHAFYDGCTSAAGAVSATTLATLQTYLPDNNLQRMDRHSMANGVETRAPFLDRRLLSFAMNLPANLRVRGRVGKYLLRKTLAREVGEDFANRPKQGFHTVPLDVWLRSDLRGMMAEYLDPTLVRNQGIFDVQYIEQLIAEHDAGGRHNHWWRIWILIVFQMWLRRWGKS